MNESDLRQALKANLSSLSKEQLVDKLVDIIIACSAIFCVNNIQRKIRDCFSNIQELKSN